MKRSHERHPDTTGVLLQRTILAALALAAVLVELTLLSWFAAEQLSAWSLLLAHAAVVALLSGFTWLSLRLSWDLRFASLLLLSTSTTGPVGGAGTILSLLLVSCLSRFSRPFSEWYDGLFPEVRVGFAERVLNDIVTSGTDRRVGTPTPFLDVLTYGSVEEKRTVISLVSKNFRPLFSTTLLKALRDPSQSVRVQAATAMATIERQFHEKALQLAQEVEREPTPPADWLELGRFYEEYSSTGLLDRSREVHALRDARRAYQRYLEECPDDLRARTELGGILVRTGEFEEALSHFLDSVRADPDDIESRLGLMDCLYELGRFEDLREMSRSAACLPEKQGSAASHRGPVSLWAGSDKNSAAVGGSGGASL